MISAVTYLARPGDPDSIDRLADTLSALVAGVAAGLIGDAVIVVGRSDDGVATVADATGAALVIPAPGQSPWQAGARVARRDWILCLEAGDVPGEGWIRTLDRFVGTARADTRFGRLRRAQAGIAERLAARRDGVIGVREARAGDLVRRDRLLAGPVFSPRLRVRMLLARIERA